MCGVARGGEGGSVSEPKLSKHFLTVQSVLTKGPEKVFLVEVYGSGKIVVKTKENGFSIRYLFDPDDWRFLTKLFLIESAPHLTPHCSCLLDDELHLGCGLESAPGRLVYRTFASCENGYVSTFLSPLISLELDFYSEKYAKFQKKLIDLYQKRDQLDFPQDFSTQGLGVVLHYDNLCFDALSRGLEFTNAFRSSTLAIPIIDPVPKSFSPFTQPLRYMKYLAGKKESPAIFELKAVYQGKEYGFTAVLKPTIKIIDYVIDGKSIASEETVKNFMSSLANGKFDFAEMFGGRCSVETLKKVVNSVLSDTLQNYTGETLYYDGFMMRHFRLNFRRSSVELMFFENPFQGVSYLKEIYAVSVDHNGKITKIDCVAR